LRKFILAFLAVLTVATVTGVSLAADPNGHLATAQGLLDQAQSEIDAAIAEPPQTITQTATVTQTVTAPPTTAPTTPPTSPPPPTTTTATPPSCVGVQVAAGADLVAIAAAQPPGTTFCLANGSYSVATPISFDKGDVWVNLTATKLPTWTPFSPTFWAAPPAAVLISSSGQPLFKSTGAGTGDAVFRGLDLSGSVDGAGGYIGQAIGASGRSIQVRLSRIHNNVGPAVASWSGDIIDSELDHNGGASGGQGGLKSVAGNAHATGIWFHDNVNGINCDFCIVADGDGPFSVTDSRITDNQAVGLKFEVSDVSAAFSGNVLIRNNLSAQTTNAAIRVLSGANIDVHDNWFSNNLINGIQIQSDSRASNIGGVHNVQVRNNTMNGDTLTGCSLSGVTCSGNN